MENIKYYVLWKKNNEMLIEYLNWYFDILVNEIENIQETEIKSKLLQLRYNKDFILNTDNSSRIEYLYYVSKWEQKIFWHENIVKNFLHDIDYFLEKTILYINDSYKIEWTNIYLSDFDRNPYNWLETHPDHFKSWTKVWYGSKSQDFWLKIYSEAFSILKGIDGWIYDELNYIIQKIVPIWTETHIHNSASYKEAVWHLYMWLTTELDENMLVIQCLEALVHESSHNKINLINKFDKILLNNYDLKFYSPYRPDARHVWWVFLWIHAFVPTIYILLRYYKESKLSDDNLLEKLVTYNTKNNLALNVLNRYANFTDIWNEIMEEVKYVMKLTNILLKELNIKEDILKISKEKVVKHFGEVKSKYSYLQY